MPGSATRSRPVRGSSTLGGVLVATTETRLRAAGVRSTLVLERAVRGVVVERDALAFDTRFAAAVAGKPEPVGHLFVLLAGRFVGATGDPIAAPCAHLLADDEIERPRPGGPTFRTDGARTHVIQLRFDRARLRAPIGLGAGVLALPPACWAAARAFAAAAPAGDADALVRLLDALAIAGVVEPGVAATACADEPARFRRLWSALQPLYASDGGTASLKQIAASLDMSMRQVARDAKELATTFGLAGGWRASLLALRLRVAVLLLSARDATVAEVARLVGYGSPIALARAFRDAALPAPSAVQAALRGGAEPGE